ncbi:MAG: hypothetical protein SF182_30630, partial [Deltaproteobacteria bacterium]|nr:hypothetical protein [Deltaproteobacteria bacterium]
AAAQGSPTAHRRVTPPALPPRAADAASGGESKPGGGWFGCQVGGSGGAPWPALVIAALLAGAVRRARRRSRRDPSDH